MYEFLIFWPQMLLTLLAISLYFLSQRLVIPRLETAIKKGMLKNSALRKAVNIYRLIYGLLAAAVILLIWGFNFQWLIAVSSGIIALTGVALFAQWSLLSNITAYFILLVHDAFKRGSFIRVIEADNYVEGYISEINVFGTTLITGEREYVVYPNNLIISRPTIINPKSRYRPVGKIQEFVDTTHSVKDNN